MAAAPRTEITFPPTEHIAESASGAVPDALSAYSSLPFRHPAPTGPSHRTDRLKLNYRFAPRRAGDITAIWADPTLANTLLGWRAERPLEETLRTAWQWQLHLGQR